MVKILFNSDIRSGFFWLIKKILSSKLINLTSCIRLFRTYQEFSWGVNWCMGSFFPFMIFKNAFLSYKNFFNVHTNSFRNVCLNILIYNEKPIIYFIGGLISNMVIKLHFFNLFNWDFRKMIIIGFCKDIFLVIKQLSKQT